MVETLCRDAGYDPVAAGPLGNASIQEAIGPYLMAIAQDSDRGLFFYRFASPTEL